MGPCCPLFISTRHALSLVVGPRVGDARVVIVARPIHGFALQALGSGGTTITDLGRRLGVSKQAAAKTVIGLEHLEYVERRRNPHDRRAALIRRTSRGDELLALSAEVFEGLRERWICELGVDRVRGLESDLERISANVKGSKLGDLSGWLR